MWTVPYRRRRSNLSRRAPYGAMAAIGARAAYSYMKGAAKPAPKKPAQKPPMRRKPMVKKPVARTLKARVKNLEKKVSNTSSILIYKTDTSETLRPAASQALYGEQSAVSIANIESAITNCRFFDPSNPSTLITGSLGTPTYAQNIRVSVYSRLVITNNYQVPCVITCGVAMPRNDTNISVNQSLINGWTDVGGPAQASTLISYKDSPQFLQVWRVVRKLRSKLLKPGESYILKYGQKTFTYDPAFTDSETESYSRKNNSAQFCYRVQGVLGHDTTVSTEQGMAPAGIDIYCENVITVYYNSGGASIKTIVLNEGADQSFTNAAVVSQPVVDNQSYSVN